MVPCGMYGLTNGCLYVLTEHNKALELEEKKKGHLSCKKEVGVAVLEQLVKVSFGQHNSFRILLVHSIIA